MQSMAFSPSELAGTRLGAVSTPALPRRAGGGRLDVQAVRRLTGKVVGIAMSKTAVVEINTYPKDRIYRKRVRTTRKFFAHDEMETCQVGDLVVIASCRPLSKRKAHFVAETIKKSTF